VVMGSHSHQAEHLSKVANWSCGGLRQSRSSPTLYQNGEILSPKKVYKSPPGPSGRPYSRRTNYIAAVIQLILAVVVVVAPFVTNGSTRLRVVGILLGAVLAWFGTVLIRQGRAAA